MEDVNLELRDPRVYEIGYHILPTIAEDARGRVTEQIEKLITDAGGLKISVGELESIDLAYPMQKIIENKRADYSRAYFGWIKFDVTPEKVQDIKTALDETIEILRYIFIGTLREDTSAAKKINAPRGPRPQPVPTQDVPNPSVSEVDTTVVVDEVELESKLDTITSDETAEEVVVTEEKKTADADEVVVIEEKMAVEVDETAEEVVAVEEDKITDTEEIATTEEKTVADTEVPAEETPAEESKES